jgi:DNA-binding GntR family transcriptional regulator
LQSLGLVALSGNFSAVVHSPNSKEMLEAFEIRAALEEISGRTAAEVLKGNAKELEKELNGMRSAVSSGDLDAYAEHDAKFHKCILKASGNTILQHVWDTLAFDVRIRIAIGKIAKDLDEVVESHQPIIEASRTFITTSVTSSRCGFPLLSLRTEFPSQPLGSPNWVPLTSPKLTERSTWEYSSEFPT